MEPTWFNSFLFENELHSCRARAGVGCSLAPRYGTLGCGNKESRRGGDAVHRRLLSADSAERIPTGRTHPSIVDRNRGVFVGTIRQGRSNRKRNERLGRVGG